MDNLGYAVGKFLNDNSFKIKGFLDNNYQPTKSFNLDNKFNINFINLKYALKKIKKDKSCVVICNKRKDHVLQITSQLIKEGISKKKIFNTHLF